MRKKLTVAIATLTAAIFAAFTSTFSWFAAKNTVTFPSSFGSAQAAYFAGGDGSKENPYLISSPVHLYNLAWLQYLGYFNLNADFNNGRAQNFFALARSIDCNLSIPPIGTEQYPFIGNFDGNGYVISNVTVSNYSADLTRRPANAQFTADVLSMPLNGGYVSDVSIVGLFGVTGDYDKFVENHYKKTDVGVTTYGELTAPGDLPSTVDVNEFYYSAMTVKNFYINALHVKSHSKETLAGLVAGYVCSNVQNTGTYACDVSLSGTKSGKSDAKNASGEAHNYEKTVSKYSIVGDYDETIVGWVEKPTETTGGGEQGDGAAWGGSIDMRTLNRRLTYMITTSELTKTNQGTTAYSSTFNLNVTFNGDEFYWDKKDGKTYLLYLNEGTMLPINVNVKEMGLDKSDETNKIINNKTWKYNDYYAEHDMEVVANNNTGYIVGNGNQATSYIRSRIQPVGGSSSTYPGIYKSLALKSTNATTTYNASNFEMLTIDIKGNTWRIKDDANKNIKESALNYDPKFYTELGFSNGGKNYATVRTNFDDTMSMSNMVHGFHFQNKFDTQSYEREKLNNREFIRGGLNFTVQSDGVIKTLLGAFFNQSNKQTLFDLYKVNRNDDGTIASVTRIKNIYKDAAGKIVYDPETTEGYTQIFSFENLTKTDEQNTEGKDILISGAAYYFEIPVTKGDYFISSDTTSSSRNAYLMYLDIGANGDGDDTTETPGTEKMPYDITRVDFVSQYTGSSDFSVPRTSEGAAYFPNYKDVTFLLALLGTDGSKATVAYKRDDYDTDPLTADELNQIATLVKYYAANVTLTATPSANLSAPDESLKEE